MDILILVTFDLKYLDELHVELFQTVHSLYPFMTCCEKISKCKSKVESNVCFQKVSWTSQSTQNIKPFIWDLLYHFQRQIQNYHFFISIQSYNLRELIESRIPFFFQISFILFTYFHGILIFSLFYNTIENYNFSNWESMMHSIEYEIIIVCY